MNEQNQLLNEEEKFSDEDMEVTQAIEKVLVSKDKDESNPVILSKERIDFDEDEIEEEKLKLPKRKCKKFKQKDSCRISTKK
ncbi:hypothetical protein TNCV_3263401 [Trichonephila clavipes]|nr:hypothetical protein TNCV_3263401 [Trichonephila clavipes]